MNLELGCASADMEDELLAPGAPPASLDFLNLRIPSLASRGSGGFLRAGVDEVPVEGVEPYESACSSLLRAHR